MTLSYRARARMGAGGANPTRPPARGGGGDFRAEKKERNYHVRLIYVIRTSPSNVYNVYVRIYNIMPRAPAANRVKRAWGGRNDLSSGPGRVMRLPRRRNGPPGVERGRRVHDFFRGPEYRKEKTTKGVVHLHTPPSKPSVLPDSADGSEPRLIERPASVFINITRVCTRTTHTHTHPSARVTPSCSTRIYVYYNV